MIATAQVVTTVRARLQHSKIQSISQEQKYFTAQQVCTDLWVTTRFVLVRTAQE